MHSLPQLIAEDIHAIEGALGALVEQSEATSAVILDLAGFVITRAGEPDGIDLSTLGALTANAYAATQAIAGLIHEPDVTSLYQEGEKSCLLISKIDGSTLLLIIFPAHVSAGAVKYFSTSTVQSLIAQLETAHARAPGQALDLSALNLSDTAPIFVQRA